MSLRFVRSHQDRSSNSLLVSAEKFEELRQAGLLLVMLFLMFDLFAARKPAIDRP